jgi:hypothetical protein
MNNNNTGSGNPITDAANKMGSMKSTNPIPQEVRLLF